MRVVHHEGLSRRVRSVAIRHAEEAGELIDHHVHVRHDEADGKDESCPVTQVQRSEVSFRSEASQSRRQQKDDAQRVQEHEGEEHPWEVFVKGSSIDPLEDNERCNQRGADQERRDDGLQGLYLQRPRLLRENTMVGRAT